MTIMETRFISIRALVRKKATSKRCQFHGKFCQSYWPCWLKKCISSGLVVFVFDVFWYVWFIQLNSMSILSINNRPALVTVGWVLKWLPSEALLTATQRILKEKLEGGSTARDSERIDLYRSTTLSTTYWFASCILWIAWLWWFLYIIIFVVVKLFLFLFFFLVLLVFHSTYTYSLEN